MRAWAVAVACTGCSSLLGIDNFKLGDAGTDAGTDASTDGISVDAAPGCLGPDGFFICGVTPAGPATFDDVSGSFNTDSSPKCGPPPPSWPMAQPAACFVIGTTINVGTNVRFVGTRALVLVATDTITISSAGMLDAAAHRGQSTGAPTGSKTVCTAPQPAGDGSGLSGGGGGAGASFMTRGGNGGEGANGTPRGSAAPPTNPAPIILRGGCSGGDGGRAAGGGQPGRGGFGGGAVLVIAKNKITIDGGINVSGAGGQPGTDAGAGGAGGGSGGMIVLYAPVIDGSGVLVANGGGGAGGSGGGQGGPGFDPDPFQPFTLAQGGAGGGVPGGFGSAGATPGGLGADGTGFQNGGGGGGGGGGYIRVNVMTATTLRISPPFSLVP